MAGRCVPRRECFRRWSAVSRRCRSATGSVAVYERLSASSSRHHGGAHVHGLCHKPHGGQEEQKADYSPWRKSAESVFLRIFFCKTPGNEKRSSQAQHQESKLD